MNRVKYGEACVVCGRQSETEIRGARVCGVCLSKVQELLDQHPADGRICKGPRTVHCQECVGNCPFGGATE